MVVLAGVYNPPPNGGNNMRSLCLLVLAVFSLSVAGMAASSIPTPVRRVAGVLGR